MKVRSDCQTIKKFLEKVIKYFWTHLENDNFYTILGKGSKDDTNTDTMESNQYNSLSSFSSIKSKIKAAVQDKYRKSSSTSLSKQIRSKFNR